MEELLKNKKHWEQQMNFTDKSDPYHMSCKKRMNDMIEAIEALEKTSKKKSSKKSKK